MRIGIELIGCIASVYILVRVAATFVDIYQRWRCGNWEDDSENG